MQELPITDISFIDREWGDGQTSQTIDPLPSQLAPSHVYTMPGSHTAQATVYTQEGAVYINEMTVYIEGNDICLEEPSPLSCDFDDDGMPDLCDSDLDGDGREQWLTLLLFETPACDFTTNIDEEELALYHLYVLQTQLADNCPFVANADQADQDGDGRGDVCDPDPTQPQEPSAPTNDQDGDGIEDNADGCPTVPESVNGIQDADGCPELPGGPGGPGDSG